MQSLPLIEVPVEAITFRRPHMQTLAGQEAMRRGEYYKRIRESIQSQGLINPLVCVKEGDKYVICLGHKRYLACLELGYTHLPLLVIPREDKALLREIILGYAPTSADNAFWLGQRKEK